MKIRHFAALSGIAIAMAASAAPVTPQEALTRASLDSRAPRAVRSAVTASPTLVKTMTSSSGAPAVYLFSTKADGFVMLPADDTCLPVLAYGDSHLTAATELPANVAWWLSEYSRQIEYAASRQQFTAVTASPAAAAASRAAIAPMVSSKWNQDAPYNSQCPTVSNRQAVTGCLATAMAQIMYYHKYPSAGTGSISYTDAYRNTYSMDFGTFDWADMLDTYTYTGSTADFTAAQGNAVAFLMKSCGYASKMNYSPYGSGATTPDGVTALNTYFGYNPSLYAADRTYYGIDDWEALIYDNLAECGPVLYTGANFEGNEGHAFVCDGYSSDGFFHFNWGWGGMCDGYFRLTALNPDAVGIGGGSGLGFNFYQDAILGIQPEATPARTPNLSQGGNLVLSLDGNVLYLSCENGVNNGFFNTTGATINGQIGIMLENQEGYTEYFWNTQTLAINYLSGYSQYGIRLPSLDNGVYKVYPAFKASGAAEGTRMEQQIAYTDFGYLTVSASGYSVSAPSAGTLTVTGVSNPSGFYIGHSFQVNATLTNSGESEFYGPVAVGLAKRSGTQLQLAAHGTIELLDLRAGESADKEFFSSLTATSALSAGEYIMLIFNPETGQVYYSESCTLNADPGTPALRATSFTVNGNASGVNARELSFAATVECTAGYFSDNLIVNLFERTGTGFQFDYVDSFNSAPVFITSGQNQNLNLAYDFVGGKVGTTYIAQLVYVRNNAEQQLAQADFTIGSSESGIEAVAADGTGAEAEYFDLTGRRISDPQPGHIYLRRTAGNVEKVIF